MSSGSTPSPSPPPPTPPESEKTIRPTETLEKIPGKRGKRARGPRSAMVSLRFCIADQVKSVFRDQNVKMGRAALEVLVSFTRVIMEIILNKALSLRNLMGSKTLYKGHIAAAVYSLPPLTTTDIANNAWSNQFTEVVWSLADRHEAHILEEKDRRARQLEIIAQGSSMPEEKRKKAMHNLSISDSDLKKKVGVNQVAAGLGFFIKPTVIRRLMDEMLPKKSRRPPPTVIALSIALSIVVNIIASNVKLDMRLQQMGSHKFTIAPKHIQRAIEMNEIFNALMGGKLSILGAPMGLLTTTPQRKRRRSTKSRHGASSSVSDDDVEEDEDDETIYEEDEEDDDDDDLSVDDDGDYEEDD